MRLTSLATLATLATFASALTLDITSYASIQQATSLLTVGLMDYYDGYKYGGTPGMFTSPYYWWEAGGAMGSMIDNWFLLQNDTYEATIKEALLFQVGTNWDYIPLNQSTTEGNDDQAFWGIAVMGAVERNFTNPGADEPSWLYLAQAVFNTMASRWDSSNCGGGLRWQIFQWNSGYDYKNTVSNGALFHMGARLARYTQNETYVDWCEKVWDWLVDVQFLTQGQWWAVYDGADIDVNCTDVVKLQWTYNVGLLLAGTAYLYNHTEDEIWLNRTLELLHGTTVFFNNSVMFEVACQGSGNCNNDQRSFKAYFSRFLGLTSIMVPSTNAIIRPLLEASAKAAAQSCSGGTDGHTCGLDWSHVGWDGYYGLGEQMAALEVIQNLLITDRPAPYTATNGGSSVGNGNAGMTSGRTAQSPLDLSAGDTAGGSIITAVIAISIIGGGVWLVL
ncbi:glycoside hydrolase family 76 protein [Babjeviella inositovora NRRL Y-12698]|uniref:Mannan endo-1,6-alpha-mannosidase n=1 Tax=Babjeviella inositovora NRRL Y-12698 TaxID=984486 RepID=A0A1E3QUG0_9ASCO|nr:glycoside hydrolase family 76 protein [Babjeviella inositovora NRRL Y-12698]ODQ81316.1 glycoside hydrolase family 76 protein [Babjeviella inositovora NRRL Y-12698]